MDLKSALEKEIEMWQLMVDNPGISRQEAFLKINGGVDICGHISFICKEVLSKKDCSYCLPWAGIRKGYCWNSPSPYQEWGFTPPKNIEKKTRAMLNFLKGEMEKMEMSKDEKSSYYDAGGIETIEIIRAKLTPEQFKGYLLGNTIKYLSRYNFKGMPERDMEKAHNYTDWLMEAEKP